MNIEKQKEDYISEQNLIKKIEEIVKESLKVKVTENQLKVMANKYLRGDSVELWLRRIARNIASADLIYFKDPDKKILEGINYELMSSDDNEKSPVLLLQIRDLTRKQRIENFRKFESNLISLAEKNNEAGKILNKTEEEFYNLLSNFDFLPNSPCLMNAGRDLQQLHACYVIPVGDSMEEIYYAVSAMAMIHQSGGGTGFSFNRIRPEGDPVQSTKGVASGPMSFIRIFDVSTDVVKQGGCVALDTRVSTSEGLMKIGEIVPHNLNVNCWKEHEITVMTDDGPKLSDEAYNNGESEVINIKTTKGYTVTATPEHRFRIVDENGEYIWKHMKDIKEGDWLALQLDSYPENVNYKLPEFNYQPHPNAKFIILPQTPTISLGELIGYFIGDGAISINEGGTGRFILSFSDEHQDTKEYIQNLMLNIFGILPQESKKENDASTNYFYNRTTLVHWLKNIGVEKDFALMARIPEIVFRAGREFAKGFLRGLFTADGTITDEGYVSLASVSEKLIDDTQQLLLSLGMPSYKYVTREREGAYGDNPLFRLSIITERGLETFKQEIRFIAEKKNQKFKSEKIKFELNDIIPNQELVLKQIHNGFRNGSTKSKTNHGTDRQLYRDIQHYLPNVKSKRNLTFRRLKFLAEKYSEIKNNERLSWFLNNNQFYDRVSFLSRGKTYTVDLSIPENNTYIANGFVSHNTRRGANMGILNYNHPDIKKFITSKSQDKGFLQNFNISVAIDENFIKAVENDSEIELLHPKTKKIMGVERARELFDLMIQSAWETGDPGIIVLDRINNSASNPTPNIGQIESTNPCGEQPLLPWEPCTLGSINLSKHVVNTNGKNVVDYQKLEYTAKLAVHFLDNVIDMGNYPLPEIELMSKGNRRIGLGVMGWAEMLVKLGIPYDSEEAITLGEEIMSFINAKALESSEEIAEKRGTFYNFKESIYDKTGKHFAGLDVKPRNCARTTIAPTGTIAITAGLQGSGIEPFFAIVYKRYQAEAVDALKKGEDPDEKYVYYEVIPLFLEIAENYNWFGLNKNTLLKKIADNHGSVKNIKEIPVNIQKIFVSSHDIPWKIHIDHQAAFQRNTDNAVSKTINMGNNVSVEEVKAAYMYAYRSGCKGLTVYRDGCKEVQVLNTQNTAAKKQIKKEAIQIDLSKGMSSDYYELETGYGPLHVNIVYDREQGPIRIFTSVPPMGTELSSLTSALGVFMSKAFQAGYDPLKAIKHLNSAKGDKPIGFGPNRVDSIPHAISIALKRHLEKTGKIGDVEQKKLTDLKIGVKSEHCPKCYSPNVEYIGGCSSPTCLDCGHSECS